MCCGVSVCVCTTLRWCAGFLRPVEGDGAPQAVRRCTVQEVVPRVHILVSLPTMVRRKGAGVTRLAPVCRVSHHRVCVCVCVSLCSLLNGGCICLPVRHVCMLVWTCYWVIRCQPSPCLLSDGAIPSLAHTHRLAPLVCSPFSPSSQGCRLHNRPHCPCPLTHHWPRGQTCSRKSMRPRQGNTRISPK